MSSPTPTTGIVWIPCDDPSHADTTNPGSEKEIKSRENCNEYLSLRYRADGTPYRVHGPGAWVRGGGAGGKKSTSNATTISQPYKEVQAKVTTPSKAQHASYGGGETTTKFEAHPTAIPSISLNSEPINGTQTTRLQTVNETGTVQ